MAGQMGMTADHRLETGSRRIQFQLVNVVKNEKGGRAGLRYRSLGQGVRPISLIDIPSHRDYRSDRSQSIQNRRLS